MPRYCTVSGSPVDFKGPWNSRLLRNSLLPRKAAKAHWGHCLSGHEGHVQLVGQKRASIFERAIETCVPALEHGE